MTPAVLVHLVQYMFSYIVLSKVASHGAVSFMAKTKRPFFSPAKLKARRLVVCGRLPIDVVDVVQIASERNSFPF